MPTKTKPKYDHVAPALWDLVQPMDAFTTHPRNARQGDIGAIIGSLQRFGQQKPIVAQRREGEPHIIIAGNHLFRAAQELGWKALAVVVAEMDDTTALAFMIADNRTQELGTYDDRALTEVLSQLAMSGALEGTGYDGDDVDQMVRALAKEGETSLFPQIEFSSELLESHNYVVLYFDNDLDWDAAKDVFGITAVQTWDSREGYERRGVGRLVNGAEVVQRLRG